MYLVYRLCSFLLEFHLSFQSVDFSFLLFWNIFLCYIFKCFFLFYILILSFRAFQLFMCWILCVFQSCVSYLILCFITLYIIFCATSNKVCTMVTVSLFISFLKVSHDLFIFSFNATISSFSFHISAFCCLL